MTRCRKTSSVFAAFYGSLGVNALLKEALSLGLLLTFKDFDPFLFCHLCSVLLFKKSLCLISFLPQCLLFTALSLLDNDVFFIHIKRICTMLYW